MLTTRRFQAGRWLPLCLALVAVFAPAIPAASAPGDLATKFPINDENPAASLPSVEEANANPLEFGYLVQDLIARGEGAFEKKDWQRSVKYYEALARAVPDRAITFRKLCSGYAELGKIDIAAANCGKALTLGGARVIDHFKFVNLSLRKAKLSPADVADMEASIAHVRAHIAAHPAAAPKPEPESSGESANPGKEQIKSREQVKDEFLKGREARALEDLERKGREEAQQTVSLPLEIEVLSCKLAVRLRDDAKLQRCLFALRGMKVDEKLLLPFEWAQALIRKDPSRAGELLDKARTLALPDAAIQAMVGEQTRTFADAGVLGFVKRWGLVVLLGAVMSSLATLGALRFAHTLRRRKLAAEPQQG